MTDQDVSLIEAPRAQPRRVNNGGFHPSWQIVRLGDIAEQLGSGITPRGGEKVYLKAGIPLIRSQNVLMNRLRMNDAAFISAEVHASMMGSAVQPGDVLLNITGASIGRVACVPEHVRVANVNQHVCRMRLADGVDPAFVCYFLSTPQGQAQIMGSQFGTTRQGLNYGNVRAIRVPLPKIGEQRRIARALQGLQAAKEIRQRELGLERERKAALMQALFKSYRTCRFESLGTICSVRYGLGQPPRKEAAGIPIVRATDIKSGRIISETVIKVARDAVPVGRNAFLKKGEIIVVRSGAYTGDVAIYDGRWAEAVAGYDLVVTIVSPDVVPEFLAYYLLGESAQRYFRSQRDRSAQPHLNAEQLNGTSVLLPPLDAQNKIVTTLHLCDGKLRALESEVCLLGELFDNTIYRFMAGTLSTSPASETSIHT